MLMDKTAAFISLGCKVNSYETEAIRSMFENAGYKIVDFKDAADVYVVNTCTVTNIADRKSRQMLHKARKQNENAIIAAVGCYVQAAKDKLLEDGSVDIVVGNNKKTELLELVEQCLKAGSDRDAENAGETGRNTETGSRVAVSDVSSQRLYEDMNVSSVMERTRAFIKIQDGCNRFCSYCIIPYVRGRIRSRDEADILAEIKKLADNGYKEFVLTGIHISSYGMEKRDDAGQTGIHNPLAALIDKIGAIPGVERIRTGSLEPGIITEDFIRAISGVRQFCPHFHLSLQSGSDTVLARMNRQYTSKEYYDKVLMLRKFYENPSITTDIIVGFPGETDKEFEETVSFAEKVGFARTHVFKYSRREGTRAAAMPGQIPEKVKHERSERLINLSNRAASEYRELFMGRIEKILVEEEYKLDNVYYQLGHNERYVKLAVQSETDLTNRLINARVKEKLHEDIMICEIIH